MITDEQQSQHEQHRELADCAALCLSTVSPAERQRLFWQFVVTYARAMLAEHPDATFDEMTAATSGLALCIQARCRQMNISAVDSTQPQIGHA